MVPIGIVFVIGVVATVRSDNTDRNDNKTNCDSDIRMLKKEISDLRKQMNDLTKQNIDILTKYETILAAIETNTDTNLLKKRLLLPQATNTPTTLVAFSVALQHSINLGQDQPVEFDKVVTNIGNGFDVRHGHFTAPVKGLYLISGSIFTNAGYYAHIDIVKNGKAIAYLYSYSNTDISTQTVMVTMEVGDMMWMKHRGDAIGKSNIYGDTTEQFTTFSGVLIQPMI